MKYFKVIACLRVIVPGEIKDGPRRYWGKGGGG